jgi:hypothetical protein
MGLSAASAIVGAEGTATGDLFKSEMLEEQAQYGELQYAQTQAQMTRNLALTLGHVDAVQAATKADPTSPTNAIAFCSRCSWIRPKLLTSREPPKRRSLAANLVLPVLW